MVLGDYNPVPVPDLPNLANLDYVDRVNRAVDYVTRNLAGPLHLEEVARAACFSSYHFHRIFRALMGETLASFVRRVRLERSVYLLSHRKGATITEIALACGFSSSSDFSRSFRNHFGVPPRRFDVDKFRSSQREAMRASLTGSGDGHRLERLPDRAHPGAFTVTLRELPARRVAYIRVHRPYEGDHVPRAAARLVAWAEARGLAGGQWLGYQWEDPEIVPLDKCRYDVGVTDAPHVIAFRFRRATGADSNDGLLELSIDGVVRATFGNLDNSTADVDMARMGMMSVKGGAAGTTFFDDFRSTRTTPP
jgi:AraC family transcriptional regulator